MIYILLWSVDVIFPDKDVGKNNNTHLRFVYNLQSKRWNEGIGIIFFGAAFCDLSFKYSFILICIY